MNFPVVGLAIGMLVILFMFAAIVMFLYRLEGIAVKLIPLAKLVLPEAPEVVEIPLGNVPEPIQTIAEFADAAQALPVEEIAKRREEESVPQPVVSKPKPAARRKTKTSVKKGTRAKTVKAEA